MWDPWASLPVSFPPVHSAHPAPTAPLQRGSAGTCGSAAVLGKEGPDPGRRPPTTLEGHPPGERLPKAPFWKVQKPRKLLQAKLPCCLRTSEPLAAEYNLNEKESFARLSHTYWFRVSWFQRTEKKYRCIQCVEVRSL